MKIYSLRLSQSKLGQLTFTYDGTTKRIYTNGVLTGIQSYGLSLNNRSNFFIGASNFTTTTGNYITAELYNFRYYDRAITQAEALAIYQNKESTQPNLEKFKLSIPFDDEVKENAVDYSKEWLLSTEIYKHGGGGLNNPWLGTGDELAAPVLLPLHTLSNNYGIDLEIKIEATLNDSITHTRYYKGWRLDQAFNVYAPAEVDSDYLREKDGPGYYTNQNLQARYSENEEWITRTDRSHRYYDYWYWAFTTTGGNITYGNVGLIFTGGSIYGCGGGSASTSSWVNLRVYVRNPNKLPSIKYIFNSHNTSQLDISLNNTVKNHKSLIPYQTDHEFTVTTNTTPSVVASNPSVTRLTNDKYIVVWNQRSISSTFDIYAKIYDNTSNVATDEFKVNTTYSTNTQENPIVAALANGGYVIVWQTNHVDSSISRIYGKIYNSSNQSSNSFEIYDTDISYYNPTVTVLTSGVIVVAYCAKPIQSSTSSLGRYNVFIRAYTTAYVPRVIKGTDEYEIQVNEYILNNQINPVVKALTYDRFIVSWASDEQDEYYSGIYAKTYDHNFDEVFKTERDTTSTVEPYYAPDGSGNSEFRVNSVVTNSENLHGSRTVLFNEKYPKMGMHFDNFPQLENYDNWRMSVDFVYKISTFDTANQILLGEPGGSDGYRSWALYSQGIWGASTLVVTNFGTFNGTYYYDHGIWRDTRSSKPNNYFYLPPNGTGWRANNYTTLYGGSGTDAYPGQSHNVWMGNTATFTLTTDNTKKDRLMLQQYGETTGQGLDLGQLIDGGRYRLEIEKDSVGENEHKMTLVNFSRGTVANFSTYKSITIPYSSDLISNEFSFSCWVYPTTGNRSQFVVNFGGQGKGGWSIQRQGESTGYAEKQWQIRIYDYVGSILIFIQHQFPN